MRLQHLPGRFLVILLTGCVTRSRCNDGLQNPETQQDSAWLCLSRVPRVIRRMALPMVIAGTSPELSGCSVGGQRALGAATLASGCWPRNAHRPGGSFNHKTCSRGPARQRLGRSVSGATRRQDGEP